MTSLDLDRDHGAVTDTSLPLFGDVDASMLAPYCSLAICRSFVYDASAFPPRRPFPDQRAQTLAHHGSRCSRHLRSLSASIATSVANESGRGR